MCTSSAVVYRHRQAVGDLRTFVRCATGPTITRLAAGVPNAGGDQVRRRQMLVDWLEQSHLKFNLPVDADVYTAILLAAALPDDDFPAFTLATAILLADRLQDGDGDDDLYWNWDSFARQYRTADAPVRAALMNGFRIASETGRVNLGAGPRAEDLLTRDRATVAGALGTACNTALSGLLRGEAQSDRAGLLWARSRDNTSQALMAFRYLYERPESMSPPDPARVQLIPWIP